MHMAVQGESPLSALVQARTFLWVFSALSGAERHCPEQPWLHQALSQTQTITWEC